MRPSTPTQFHIYFTSFSPCLCISAQKYVRNLYVRESRERLIIVVVKMSAESVDHRNKRKKNVCRVLIFCFLYLPLFLSTFSCLLIYFFSFYLFQIFPSPILFYSPTLCILLSYLLTFSLVPSSPICLTLHNPFPLPFPFLRQDSRPRTSDSWKEKEIFIDGEK